MIISTHPPPVDLAGNHDRRRPFHPRTTTQIDLLRLLRRHQTLPLPHLKQLHARLFRLHLHHDPILLSNLISSSTSPLYASLLFHSAPSPDLALHNALLKALNPSHALAFFLHRILLQGLLPDSYTFTAVLKACASASDPAFGAQSHAWIAKRRYLSGDSFVLNSLVDMYFKCGRADEAIRVFEESGGAVDCVSWNVLVSGLIGCGRLGDGVKVFEDMQRRDVASWNAVLSGYANVGEMGAARKMFEDMPERNLVSWNALIAGYVRNGDGREALLVFSRMLGADVVPDESTVIGVVSACKMVESLDDGVVDRIAGFTEMVGSVSAFTALLSLYCKFERLDEAREIFDKMPEKDLVAWNAMIGGYSQNQRPTEAIDLFRLMQREERVRPDGMTMACLVDSCSQMSALGLGEWIHAYIRKNNIEMDTFLLTALVDMYAKCGDLDQSRYLFSKIEEKDVASWNAMIKGLAVHGKGDEALDVFSLMEKNGVSPDEITFVGLLSACGHGGQVEQGLELYYSMQSKYNVVPRIEHHGCVVDLLGRVGRLDEAFEFIRNMPIKPDSVVWGALLSACRSHRNLELAEKAATKVIELEPGHDGNYILLSNAYASAGKWADVEKVRQKMRAGDLCKELGCSEVELYGIAHEFSSGDKSHPRSADIYAAWDELVELLKPMGYQPDTKALLRNLDEEDKEEALYRHSEKLALSFALISSAAKTPIRIVKNLRICTDCHRAMELVSQLKHREIIVRDRSRFHHFVGGSCSCGGYW